MAGAIRSGRAMMAGQAGRINSEEHGQPLEVEGDEMLCEAVAIVVDRYRDISEPILATEPEALRAAVVDYANRRDYGQALPTPTDNTPISQMEALVSGVSPTAHGPPTAFSFQPMAAMDLSFEPGLSANALVQGPVVRVSLAQAYRIQEYTQGLAREYAAFPDTHQPELMLYVRFPPTSALQAAPRGPMTMGNAISTSPFPDAAIIQAASTYNIPPFPHYTAMPQQAGLGTQYPTVHRGGIQMPVDPPQTLEPANDPGEDVMDLTQNGDYLWPGENGSGS
jgi:hypothetical protein